ncbi:salicylate esterase [Minicystis rosea]|nr:salicylate esterase [Minicystis rosea]
MSIFVLIHGAFNGGWCWKHVARRLRSAGHDVFTPSLTGCAERSHLLAPNIGLSTHVQDIVNVLEFEDLEGVILAGHSSAGVAVTAAADRVPKRVSKLVYVDAAAPENGQNATGAFADGTASVLASMVEGQKDSWLLPPLPLAAESIVEPDHVAWVASKRIPFPLLVLQEPLRLTSDAVHRIPKAYIYAKQRDALIATFGVDPLKPFSDRARHDPDWRFLEVDAGHGLMITAPDAVTDALLELV